MEGDLQSILVPFRRLVGIGQELFDQLDFDYLTLMMVLDTSYTGRKQGVLASAALKAKVIERLESARSEDAIEFKRAGKAHTPRDYFDVVGRAISDLQHLGSAHQAAPEAPRNDRREDNGYRPRGDGRRRDDQSGRGGHRGGRGGRSYHGPDAKRSRHHDSRSAPLN